MTGTPDGVRVASPPRWCRTGPRSADAASVVAVFVVLQFVLPAQLVMNWLPLSLSSASLVALALGVLWMCTQLTTTLGAAKGRNPVRTMLIAYVVALMLTFASTSAAYLPDDERSVGDHAIVTLLAMVFVALTVCDGVTTRERLYFLLRVVVGSATCVASVGILQFLFTLDITPYLDPPGMHFNTEHPSVLTRSGLRRVAGTTAHPIELGVFCAMVLPLALHLTTLRTSTRAGVALTWACVGFLAAGLMFSVSRSAIVAAVCAGTVLFIGWSRQRRVRILVTGAVFLVMVEVLAPSILTTFLDLFRGASSDNSVHWRTHDYAAARDLVSQHLLFGRGTGTWYAPKHTIFDNQYLLTSVDSGLVGLLALLGIFGAGVYATCRVTRQAAPSAGRIPAAARDRDLALSLMASLLVVFPAFATFDFMSFATVASLAFLLAGLAGALLRIVGRETPEDSGSAVTGAATAR